MLNQSNSQYRGMSLNDLIGSKSNSKMHTTDFNLHQKWAINSLVQTNARKNAKNHYNELYGGTSFTLGHPAAQTAYTNNSTISIKQKAMSTSIRIKDWNA